MYLSLLLDAYRHYICVRTQKLWKWHVSSRFPRYRICLMGRSSCCDTVVKETDPHNPKNRERL